MLFQLQLRSSVGSLFCFFFFPFALQKARSFEICNCSEQIPYSFVVFASSAIVPVNELEGTHGHAGESGLGISAPQCIACCMQIVPEQRMCDSLVINDRAMFSVQKQHQRHIKDKSLYA